mgnify:CR=1 FL=1
MSLYFTQAQSISKEKPTYNLSTITGDNISLQSQGKTTVIYFFAPWCQVCHISIGNLQFINLCNPPASIILSTPGLIIK